MSKKKTAYSPSLSVSCSEEPADEPIEYRRFWSEIINPSLYIFLCEHPDKTFLGVLWAFLWRLLVLAGIIILITGMAADTYNKYFICALK
jgi:hypothetical protein